MNENLSSLRLILLDICLFQKFMNWKAFHFFLVRVWLLVNLPLGNPEKRTVTSSFRPLFSRRLKFSVENLNGHTGTVQFCCCTCIIHFARRRTPCHTSTHPHTYICICIVYVDVRFHYDDGGGTFRRFDANAIRQRQHSKNFLMRINGSAKTEIESIDNNWIELWFAIRSFTFTYTCMLASIICCLFLSLSPATTTTTTSSSSSLLHTHILGGVTVNSQIKS